MITIAQAVEEEVSNSPLLQAGLKQNILNLSAVARELKPIIEEKTFKDTSTNAIQLALQRLDRQLFQQQKKTKITITQMEVTNHLVMVAGPLSSLLAVAAQVITTLPQNSPLMPQLFSNEGKAVLVFRKEVEAVIRAKLRGDCEVHYEKSLVRIELSEDITSDNASVLSHQLSWRNIETDLVNLSSNRAILVLDNSKAKSLANVFELLIED